MVVTPNSRVILLKSPLKLDNYNQITFDNVASQFNYFYNLPKIEEWNYTYVRKDGVLRVETSDNLTFEDLLEYNYCMYQNTHYDNKWFYAFVTDITYMNDGMTEVQIETDPFQTWQFEIDYKNSFIEREHVSDDTIGSHTVPEDLELGEYIVNSAGSVDTSLDTTIMWVVGTSWVPVGAPFTLANRIIGGVYSGLYYFVFRFTESIDKFIKGMAEEGHTNDIVNLFTLPLSLIDMPYADGWSTISLGQQTGIELKPLKGSANAIVINNNITISLPNSIDGYTPLNNKMFTYPFVGLSITNNCGTDIDYRYEDFSGTPSFSIIGVPSPSGSVWLYPNNYKKNSTAGIGYSWGMPIGKYPQGSWRGDQYTNWLTQNGVNILGHRVEAPKAQAIAGSIQAMVGAITGNADGIATGLGGMFGAVQEQYRHSMMPSTIGGQVNSGDVAFASDKMSPTYYKMTIKQEYARICDNWFTMYGYKVNRLATPNIHKRSNWDYIKCIDVNLEGNIPEKDLDSIRSLFNNGCTFWHTTTYYLDYRRTNSIL